MSHCKKLIVLFLLILNKFLGWNLTRNQFLAGFVRFTHIFLSYSVFRTTHSSRKKKKKNLKLIFFAFKKNTIPLISAVFHLALFFICLPIYLYWVFLVHLVSSLCWCCVVRLWRAIVDWPSVPGQRLWQMLNCACEPLHYAIRYTDALYQ